MHVRLMVEDLEKYCALNNFRGEMFYDFRI